VREGEGGDLIVGRGFESTPEYERRKITMKRENMMRWKKRDGDD